MSSFAERKLRLFLAGLLCTVALPACFDSRPCGSEETCNDFDDDCDGLVDEGFVDDEGRYVLAEHCGGCGVRCDDVFPTAASTECRLDARGDAGCVLLACPEGFHRAGDGACVEDVPVLCLPCNADEDCELRAPGAVCVPTDAGGRCAPACETGCPDGTECRTAGVAGGFCFPVRGDCQCNEPNVGLEIGCLVDRGDGQRCGGARSCGVDGGGAFGFSDCAPVLAEACNGEDDDCDGRVDEDFTDDAGRYVSDLHCGACAQPCFPPGDNTLAVCSVEGPAPVCQVACEDGFVDVDGVQANGCECERFDGGGPPPVIGGDANCDGLPDDDDGFVFVTPTGSDSNPGTLARPLRTLGRAQDIASAEGKDVLVARGIYDGGFEIAGGVSVFGGYRPDFRDRDLELYPVLIERSGDPGLPPLTCRGVDEATRFEGFTVVGSDATAEGSGTTAIYLDDCGPEIVLASITVLAGAASPGSRGDDSSDNLSEWGLSTLDALRGVSGTAGASTDMQCTAAAGRAGRKACSRGRGATDVSGGRGGDGACPALRCTQDRPCGNAGCTDFTSGGVCDLEAAISVAAPNPSAAAGRGPSAGEAGVVTYNAPTNRRVCNFCDDNPTLPRLGQSGGDGDGGLGGTSGAGCDASPLVDPATGRLAAEAGGDGTAGTDGSGGGGGSAGAGYAVIGGTTGGCSDVAGGAGGGGGSGGCGAPRAEGGQGGGGAVGVVIRLGSGQTRGPTLTEVRVVTGSGGAGGDGGVGAAGGAPGIGGAGGSAAFFCARAGGGGGDGGAGGAGGAGGGGCGGGSHGIVVLGNAEEPYRAVLQELSIERTGVPGRGGRGGFSPAGSGSDGRNGGDETVLFLSP